MILLRIKSSHQSISNRCCVILKMVEVVGFNQVGQCNVMKMLLKLMLLDVRVPNISSVLTACGFGENQ